MVGLRDKSYERLVHFGLAEVKVCSFGDTGFHPWNRSNTAIVPTKVSAKVMRFYQMGFSLTECAKSVSVQRRPGPVGDKHESANIEIINAAGGVLAPVKKEGSLSQFSLTCNHTCQAVRAASAGAVHTDPVIAPNGYISLPVMMNRDPTIAQAITNGMPWLQLHWQVEEMFPDVIRIIIEADNIPNAIAEKDSASTLLWKCHAAIKGVYDEEDGKPEDEKMSADDISTLIEARVLRSEIGRETEVPQYVAFAKEWSGGVANPFVLREFDAYTKVMPEARDINGSMIAKLAKLDLGPAQGALWRLATLKVAANPSEKPVVQSDVAAMSTTKNKPHVLSANLHMTEARKVMEDALKAPTVNIGKLERARDLLDQRLVKHVLNRSRDFKSSADICFKFLEDVVAAGAASTHCPSQWQQKKTASSTNAASGVKRGIQELTASGPSLASIIDVLKSKGCEVGSQCTHAQSGKSYKVVSITNTAVEFKGTGPKETDYGANMQLSVSHADVGSVFRSFSIAEKDQLILSFLLARLVFENYNGNPTTTDPLFFFQIMARSKNVSHLNYT